MPPTFDREIWNAKRDWERFQWQPTEWGERGLARGFKSDENMQFKEHADADRKLHRGQISEEFRTARSLTNIIIAFNYKSRVSLIVGNSLNIQIIYKSYFKTIELAALVTLICSHTTRDYEMPKWWEGMLDVQGGRTNGVHVMAKWMVLTCGCKNDRWGDPRYIPWGNGILVLLPAIFMFYLDRKCSSICWN